MSEFFKALEQADRDRQRREGVREPERETTNDKGEPRELDPRWLAPTPPARRRPLRVETPSEPTERKTSRNLPVLVTQLEPNSVAAEAYRTLRTNLEFVRMEQPCRNVAVTSPVPGSGKSTTAANLAVVAAQAGRRVCLVDADFWRPVLHEVFSLRNTDGLRAALEGSRPLHSVARQIDIENLSVVVSGQSGSNPAPHLFTTQRLQTVLQDGGGHFDLVIFDTPPILSVSDPVNLAALCDGVLMVVRYGAVPPTVLRRAVQQVTQVNGRILGVLLNQVNLRGGDDEVYSYYQSYVDKPRR